MAGNLRREDWLHLAQGLAIGRNARYPHKGDRTTRPNLVVSNAPDRWSAYCMSCKRGAAVFKEHVRYSPRAPKASTELALPKDMQHWRELPLWQRENIARFLLSKNMSALFLPELYYSKERERLLLSWAGAWLGRDLTGDSPQKWLTYNGARYLPPALAEGKPVALVTEDPFSMFKVAAACPEHAVYCALGTRLTDALALALSGQHSQTLFLFDGDKPGWEGALRSARRMRGLGQRAREACAPWGQDPKDMAVAAISLHVQEALHGC